MSLIHILNQERTTRDTKSEPSGRGARAEGKQTRMEHQYVRTWRRRRSHVLIVWWDCSVPKTDCLSDNTNFFEISSTSEVQWEYPSDCVIKDILENRNVSLSICFLLLLLLLELTLPCVFHWYVSLYNVRWQYMYEILMKWGSDYKQVNV